MPQHRLVKYAKINFLSISPPFSSFDYIEDCFGNLDSLRRIFSLARSFNAKSLIREEISATGIIKEENDEIEDLFNGYKMNNLIRLSFWSTNCSSISDINTVQDKDLIGYALLKQDVVQSESYKSWHVFEAVFRKYKHRNNCVPNPATYTISVGESQFQLPGLLYCQQNGLNKACAHVALRSLLSRIIFDTDVSYKQMNTISLNSAEPDWHPKNGLNVQQIRDILTNYKIEFRDIDYTSGPSLQEEIPFQKLAYAGLESGTGALVGFKLSGRDLQKESRHIIPFYGHTFNKDTWAPDADVAYFHIGEGVGYIPSESWTSSFLGHDDNFGPNFCIPRLYIKPEQVEYVVELFQPGVRYSGVQAEALALHFLYSIIPSLPSDTNIWIKRLVEWTRDQQIVLRAQSLKKEDYVSHLEQLRDWDNRKEDIGIFEPLKEELPDVIWMIELSTPQLFPANEHKLGEIILDASIKADYSDMNSMFELFFLSRLPGLYVFGNSLDKNSKPSFTSIKSNLISHTDIYRRSID